MQEAPWLLGDDPELRIKVPLAVGTLQWGTTSVDERIISGGRIGDGTAADILRTLVQAGVELLDTAEGYGGGTSEERLGFLQTQLTAAGVLNDGDAQLMLATKFLPTAWRWTHASFERALRGSLARLGISSCPIYFLHSPIHPRPIEFWVEAAAICKRKGLLHSLGLSNCNAEQVRRAVAAGARYGVGVSCNQIMLSLLDYNSSTLQDTLRACRECKVTVLAYSPIGQGLLTDKLTDESFRRNRPARMMRIDRAQLDNVRAPLSEIARARGRTMAQVALNWCICHGAVPLVGCRSAAQAQDSLGCLGWRLTADERDRLDAAALSRSTLDGPTWRRGLFVFLAGVLMGAYRVAIGVNKLVGSGTQRIK